MAGTWIIRSLDPETGHDPETNLLDLGVTDFKIKFCNRAADEATIQFERRDPIFYPNTIWSELEFGKRYHLTCDGSPIFTGRLEKMKPVGDGPSHKAELFFSGGWRYLELAMFWSGPNLSGRDDLGSTNSARWYMHRSACHVGNDSGEAISEQITLEEDIFHAIRCASLYLESGIDADSNRVCAEAEFYDAGVESITQRALFAPYSTFSDLTCAEVMNKLLAYFPRAAVWSEFGTSDNPNHDVRIPFLCVDLLVGVPVTAIPDPPSNAIFLSSPNVESFDIDIPLPDRTPASEVILVGGGPGWQHSVVGRHETTDNDATTTEHYVGSILTTIDGEDANSPLRNQGTLTSLASLLFDSNRYGYPEGNIVLVGRDPPKLHDLRPSKFLFLGGYEGNQTVRATPIQSVKFDIGNGRTTIKFGCSSYLGSQDLTSLRAANPFVDALLIPH